MDLRMENEKLLAFHEKLYYHELESREKLTARLQLCMGILTVLIGLMAYMVAHFDPSKANSGFWGVALLVTYLFGAAGLIAASHEFVCALWNHTYECLPFATQIEEYRCQLLKTYSDFDDCEQTTQLEYEKFLLKYMTECASVNAALNAKRYEHLHKSTSLIVYSIPLITISALAFVVGGFLKQGAV